MWAFITTPSEAVQFVLMVLCTLFGVSHIVRPAIWTEFFGWLHAAGHRGVVLKTFALELWPAMMIVTLHQVWSGPGMVITLYGWAQLIKIAIAMLMPEITLRGLKMAEGGSRAFVPAGVVLAGIGVVSGVALFGPW
jgi:hypothetical protein